jgi:hypothetical protein
MPCNANEEKRMVAVEERMQNLSVCLSPPFQHGSTIDSNQQEYAMSDATRHIPPVIVARPLVEHAMALQKQNHGKSLQP